MMTVSIMACGDFACGASEAVSGHGRARARATRSASCSTSTAAAARRPIASSRDRPSRRTARRAAEYQELRAILLAEAEHHAVSHEPREHVAVHEDRRIAEHLAPLRAAKRRHAGVERAYERR